MKITKQKIVHVLRKLHLLQLTDDFRYLLSLKSTWWVNRNFSREQPNFIFPPSYLSYDAYSHTNWPVYYYTGIANARYIAHLITANLSEQSLAVCEWGCGPARIIRHMASFSGEKTFYLHGFDYNPSTIKWCKNNIKGIDFDLNTLNPPLPCKTSSFDCVYNLSVFTHLSEEMHFKWVDELQRVVKPGGLIIITTHGDNFKHILVGDELHQYEMGKLVVRGEIEEGKRCYVAYHPEKFVLRELLHDGLDVIAHYPGPVIESMPQDVWVIRNNKSA